MTQDSHNNFNNEQSCGYNATYQVTYLQGEGQCLMVDVDSGLSFLVNAVELRNKLKTCFEESSVDKIEGKLFGGFPVKINFTQSSASTSKPWKLDPYSILSSLTSVGRLTSVTDEEFHLLYEEDVDLMYSPEV